MNLPQTFALFSPDLYFLRRSYVLKPIQTFLSVVLFCMYVTHFSNFHALRVIKDLFVCKQKKR